MFLSPINGLRKKGKRPAVTINIPCLQHLRQTPRRSERPAREMRQPHSLTVKLIRCQSIPTQQPGLQDSRLRLIDREIILNQLLVQATSLGGRELKT